MIFSGREMPMLNDRPLIVIDGKPVRYRYFELKTRAAIPEIADSAKPLTWSTISLGESKAIVETPSRNVLEMTLADAVTCSWRRSGREMMEFVSI